MNNRNKIKISTLEHTEPLILPNIRQIGNTTRLVDTAIQIIFSGYICVVKDHVNNRKMNEFLFHKILKRLEMEHSGSFNKINIDKINLEISLK